MSRPTRTSFSAIRMWEECAASYKFSYIDKAPDPAGDAAARGSRLHLSGELFLKGDLKVEKLPVDYWRVKAHMLEYKKHKAKAEEVWCVDKNWKMCLEDDPNILLKAVVDVHYYVAKSGVLFIVDLKTGRIYDSHGEQLQIYAVLGLIKYPKAKLARVSGLYIDQGREDHIGSYPRKMLPLLIAHWDEKAKAVLTDEVFAPNPSVDNCKWCNFHAKKGGPCRAGIV